MKTFVKLATGMLFWFRVEEIYRIRSLHLVFPINMNRELIPY